MDEPDHSAAAGRFRLLLNPRYRGGDPYPPELAASLNRRESERAAAEIRSWPEYRRTPLVALDDIARECGIASVMLKDESARFGLSSFKAVGAALGAMRALRGAFRDVFGIDASAAAIRRGEYAQAAAQVVLACATDGNHGRAVAWAAAKFGCRCEVFVPRIVSAGRRAGIAALGARLTEIDGTYDDAIAALERAATARGWVVVSDQAYPGYESIPRQIMSGYTLVAAEALQDWPLPQPPTHVLAQAGVGGFAAAVCAHLWETLGAAAPRFVCVEPLAADCLMRSAEAGKLAKVPGDLDTVMACLSCGEASPPAWQILDPGAAAYLAVDDHWAVEAMRKLAFPESARPPLVVGESGAAGLAGLLALRASAAARRQLRLSADSRVLLFATEGATDPANYAALVGASPASVRAGGSSAG